VRKSAPFRFSGPQGKANVKYTILTALIMVGATCVAGTNTDSEGYVTNAALMAPFTFTNNGAVISNAVLVKLTPNKFIYKRPDGGEGMVSLSILPPSIRQKIGFDPNLVANADSDDADRKEREQQASAARAQWNAQLTYWNAALQGASAPYTFPNRRINGKAITIAPVLLWWKNHAAAPRRTANYNDTQSVTNPFPSWVHITGTIVNTAANCWIMNAYIEDNPGHTTSSQIVLADPPIEECGEFYQARAALDSLNSQINNLQSVADDIPAEKDANNIADSVAGVLSGNNDAVHEYYQDQHMQIVNKDYNLWRQQGVLTAQRPELERFLAQFPPGNVYQINSFVMNTGRTINGMQIYDAGVRIQ
jgi:hypothetical protein